MDDKRGYSSVIAAEAVGETLASPPPDAGEQTVRPVGTSAGGEARVADQTAESIGERAGDAYADASPDEARERSQKVVQRRAKQAGNVSRFNDRQTFAVFAAFALGFAAASLIRGRSQMG